MSGDKPPTPKMVRHHYRRVDMAIRRLRAAMNAAHNADVIVYEKYPEDSPGAALDEVRTRVNKSTEKQLAQAMREEIRGSSR